MTPQEREARLRAMLKGIVGTGGGLESLPPLTPRRLPDGFESVDPTAPMDAVQRAVTGGDLSLDDMLGLEALVLPDLRPVTLVRANKYDPVTGEFAYMNQPDVRARLEPLIPSIGRVELPTHPSIPYAGTGFVVGKDLIMTNRHVAEFFTEGVGTKTLIFRGGDAAIDFEREQPEESPQPILLTVREVVMIHPYWDMALLRVEGLDRKPLKLGVVPPEDLTGQDIVVIGYPGKGREHVAVQDRVFSNIYYVKRFQPGKLRARRQFKSFDNQVSALVHDASTLGGNSGSAVIHVKSGTVIGLHFAGLYLDANFGVPMSELAADPRVVGCGLDFQGRVTPSGLTDAAWKTADSTKTVVSPARSESSSSSVQTSPSTTSAPSLANRTAPTLRSTPAIRPAPTPVSRTRRTTTSTTISFNIPINITVDVGVPTFASEPDARHAPSVSAVVAQPVVPAVATADPLVLDDVSKREAVARMVKLERVDGGLEGTESTSGPLDEKWLRQIQAAQSELRKYGEAAMATYRDFYKKPTMTVDEAAQILGQMALAIGRPEEFHEALEAAAREEASHQEGPINWLNNLVHTGLDLDNTPSKEQQEGIDHLRAVFKLGTDIEINPNDHQYETSDPGYWHLLKADKWDRRHWPEGLAQYIEHTTERPFVYADPHKTTKVALMADFGVGKFHCRYIARQLEQKAYPYVFHLGDVYYGGTQEEFDNNYSGVLDRLMNRSTLFSIPENHELYSGGESYQKFLSDELSKGRIIQEGSYFCVRFREHQIIGIDVNWNGRQRFTHEPSRGWLRMLLASPESKRLTTILLTGSAPYCYGDKGTTTLFDDLREWHEQGLFHAWFWGDDHYCALFERSDQFKFVGSCIGHAGFPGDQQKDGEKCAATPVWVETASKFPDGYNLRTELTNNGWVELSMIPGGGIELKYTDWLGELRCDATYKRTAAGLELLIPPVKPVRPTGPFRDTESLQAIDGGYEVRLVPAVVPPAPAAPGSSNGQVGDVGTLE